MAYGLRLTIEGSDIAGNNVDIKVYLEGYTNAPVTRSGAGDVFQIKWGSDSGEMLPQIYGSEAIIRFIAENDFEFNDLFATNTRDVKVEIILNETNLIWTGFMEAEKWSEPLISPEFEVSFSAFDGLGLLKDEDFLDANKDYYTGSMTLQSILHLLLSKTGLSLPINTRVNYRPSGQVNTANSLEQAQKDVISYRGMTCYEVMEKLFMNCRIFQRDGEWYVISNDAWYGDTITCYAYTAAGVANGTKVINTTFTGYWFEDEARLDWMPPIKQVKVKQDYGLKGDLIDNSDFGKFEDSAFDNWTEVGVIAEQHPYDSEGGKYAYLIGNERLDGPSGSWADANRQHYLISDPIPIKKASDLFNFGLSYALRGPESESAYMFWSLWLAGDDGKNYSIEIYREGAPTREIKYRWKESTYKLPIPVASYVDKDNHYRITPERIRAYSYTNVVNHFATAKFSIENGIPTTGTIQIYLFLPHSGNTVHGSCWREVDLFLTDEEEQEFPATNNFVLINSLRNNFTPKDIELPHGDLPDTPNALTVYSGGFTLTDGTATPAWKYDGSVTTYSYAELMARLLAAQMYIARHSYKARLADVSPSTSLRFVDPDNSNRKFLEAGITYDFRMNTIEGKFIEVLPVSISPYSIVPLESDEGSPSSGGGSSSGSGSTPTPTLPDATDEKVKLIDPDTMEILGQAGYLSALSFTSRVDEVSGKAIIDVIQPKQTGFGEPRPIVTWVSGLTFDISYGIYYIQGPKYYCPPTTKTLSAADATHPRIDIFAVTTDYECIVIEGTPAANPVKPTVNPNTQLELTQVYIPANATEPTTPGGDPVANTIVYDENTEWTASASGTTADFASTTAPANGSVCAEITNIGRLDYLKFSSASAHLFTDFSTLNLQVKLKEEMPLDHNLFMALVNGTKPVTNYIKLNLDKIATGWQKMAVAMEQFTKTGTQFDAVLIIYSTVTTGETHAGFYLDYIYFQEGIDQPEYEDTYVTAATFDAATRTLAISQNNGKEDIEVELPLVRGQNYFLHTNASDIATYESLLKVPSDHTEEIQSVSIVSADGETLIQEFATLAGEPGTNQIEKGIWEFDFYHYVSSAATGTTTFVYRVFKRNAAGTETELFNLETAAITATVETLFKTYYAATTDIDLLISDRLVLKVYAKTTSASAVTAYLVYEGDTSASHLQTPVTISAVNSAQKDWIEFEFRDIEAGTAAEYILDLKALVAYTIDSAVLQVDDGTLNVSFTINGTTVTGPSVSASTTITETAATAANSVATGNIVKLVVSTTYTGTPTLIRGKLNLTRT